MEKTDNEVIAEFMGWRRAGESEDGVFHKGQWFHTVTYENMAQSQDIHYQTSWDWLMPVVEKITDIGLNDEDILFSDWYRDVNKYSVTVKIDHVYKAVVEFIKWYNEVKNK